MTPGYDVSKHQGGVDHAAFFDAGYRFCYVKATEGTGYRDPRFQANMRDARQHGLLTGAYHFARVSRSPTLLQDAADEARWFASQIKPFYLDPALPPVLDIEWDKRVAAGIDAQDLIDWCLCWLEIVEPLTGRLPMVYTGSSFWRYKLGTSLDLAGYPLWQADYRKSSMRRGSPKEIEDWPALFWQHTGSKPRPDDPTRRVDANLFMGSAEELQNLDPEYRPHGVNQIYQPPWARAIMRIMGRLTVSPRRAQ
jgi:lysozyme